MFNSLLAIMRILKQRGNNIWRKKMRLQFFFHLKFVFSREITRLIGQGMTRVKSSRRKIRWKESMN